MGQQKKAAKLMRRKDRLGELPDEILSLIISMLTLKEAVRASVLSKKWKYVWTAHTDMLFDSGIVLGGRGHGICGCQSECERQKQQRLFTKQVNYLMHQRGKGPKIDSLVIHFPLGPDFAFQIDEWICCALTKGVESVDLDLSVGCCGYADASFTEPSSIALENYPFPCWLLVTPGIKSLVKHLKLASCALSSFLGTNSLTSLVTVELQDVSINDQQLEKFLSVCLFLEKLSLHLCGDVVTFKLAGPSFKLKFLSIQHCFRLNHVHINAGNLAMLEYSGQLVGFSFENVQSLAEVFLSFTRVNREDALTYALTKFPCDLPHLGTLNLLSVLAMKTIKLPEKVPEFSNIKQLVLTVFPFDDEDKLSWMSYILKAFPQLCRLKLNLFSPSYIKKSKKILRELPECTHWHLKELEINGFYGNEHETDLLEYLLDNALRLRVLVVNSRQKAYQGLHKWNYEETSLCYKLRNKSVEWLHAMVPRTVQLNIL